MEIINITYIPPQNSIQALISFEYKGKTEHTTVPILLDEKEGEVGVTTDFKKIAEDEVFLSKCREAIVMKIENIDKPLVP